jgi:hypothetical protein
LIIIVVVLLRMTHLPAKPVLRPYNPADSGLPLELAQSSNEIQSEIAELGRRQSPLSPQPHVALHFQRAFEREFDYLQHVNYVYLDDRNRFSVTWKGAVMMTCRILFQQSRLRKKARQLLAQLFNSSSFQRQDPQVH